MKFLALIVISIILMVPLAHAVDMTSGFKLPSDVVKFKQSRDLCDHFIGEEPYDEQRKKDIENGIKKYCTGTDKKLASLKEKYKNNKAVLNELVDYDDKIEWID